jgi:tRNA G46 methylase TrmB
MAASRSLVRLNKNWVYRNKLDEPEDATNNVLLLRADLIDFWHLCLTSLVWQQTVHVKKHYLLYPNPYPKKARLKNRFYAHPAFPLLMLTLMMEGDEPNDSTQMIVRSNWKGYLEEFALSVAVWKETELDWNDLQNVPRRIDEGDCHEKWTMKGPERIESATNVPMTNFEAKFFSCGEPVYELDIKLLNNTTRVF